MHNSVDWGISTDVCNHKYTISEHFHPLRRTPGPLATAFLPHSGLTSNTEVALPLPNSTIINFSISEV